MLLQIHNKVGFWKEMRIQNTPGASHCNFQYFLNVIMPYRARMIHLMQYGRIIIIKSYF